MAAEDDQDGQPLPPLSMVSVSSFSGVIPASSAPNLPPPAHGASQSQNMKVLTMEVERDSPPMAAGPALPSQVHKTLGHGVFRPFDEETSITEHGALIPAQIESSSSPLIDQNQVSMVLAGLQEQIATLVAVFNGNNTRNALIREPCVDYCNFQGLIATKTQKTSANLPSSSAMAVSPSSSIQNTSKTLNFTLPAGNMPSPAAGDLAPATTTPPVALLHRVDIMLADHPLAPEGILFMR